MLDNEGFSRRKSESRTLKASAEIWPQEVKPSRHPIHYSKVHFFGSVPQYGPSRGKGSHKQRRCGLPKMHGACLAAMDTGFGIISILWLEPRTLLYSSFCFSSTLPPTKLFLRQHKDTSEKAGHPSCLRQLSLCSNHRVTELAMRACQREPIDWVPCFYD